jgi:hypothetical protein
MTIQSNPSNAMIVGSILTIAGSILLLFAIIRFNSFESSFVRGFGGEDAWLGASFYLSIIILPPGLVLLTRLRLTRLGWALFLLLLGFFPFVAWVPLLIPALKVKQQSTLRDA